MWWIWDPLLAVVLFSSWEQRKGSIYSYCLGNWTYHSWPRWPILQQPTHPWSCPHPLPLQADEHPEHLKEDWSSVLHSIRFCFRLFWFWPLLEQSWFCILFSDLRTGIRLGHSSPFCQAYLFFWGAGHHWWTFLVSWFESYLYISK